MLDVLQFFRGFKFFCLHESQGGTLKIIFFRLKSKYSSSFKVFGKQWNIFLSEKMVIMCR